MSDRHFAEAVLARDKDPYLSEIRERWEPLRRPETGGWMLGARADVDYLFSAIHLARADARRCAAALLEVLDEAEGAP